MRPSRNAAAWRIVCQRWQSDHRWFDDATAPAQRSAHDHLIDLKAIRPAAANQQFALCGHCGLHTAQVYRDGGGLGLHCPECGPVSVAPRDMKAWLIDEGWLIRKLRAALNIPAQQEAVPITSGVWRIGIHQRRSVVLARRLDLVVQQHVLSRARGAVTPWLISPKPLRNLDHDPLAGAASWLPMEERFTLYGGNVSFIESGAADHDEVRDSMDPVHGPFSNDFRWVRLQGEGSAIKLSQAQAAVFKSLWDFGGQPQEAHLVMSRVGLDSDKPIDVFKVKAQHKGDPRYEGPHRAYKSLVKTNQRSGTYAMACAEVMVSNFQPS